MYGGLQRSLQSPVLIQLQVLSIRSHIYAQIQNSSQDIISVSITTSDTGSGSTSPIFHEAIRNDEGVDSFGVLNNNNEITQSVSDSHESSLASS